MPAFLDAARCASISRRRPHFFLMLSSPYGTSPKKLLGNCISIIATELEKVPKEKRKHCANIYGSA